MRAVVLGGGKGTRLSPLTLSTPKPMIPIFNKPILEYTFELLSSQGIKDFILTLGHGAEQVIDYFGGGSKWGVDIQYLVEDLPRGTAGSLRLIQPILDEIFLVVPCSMLTNFNVSQAVEFHKEKSALATMIVHKSKYTTDRPIADLSSDGMIQRYMEAPTNKAPTMAINTGIYVFEPEIIDYIPYEGYLDFETAVFPRLLANQESFYGFQIEGYWQEISNLPQYRKAHFDALIGQECIELPAQRVADGIWIGEGAKIHGSTKLQAPVYIGEGATIRKNSIVGRFAVVGNGSTIEEGTRVAQSILGPDTRIGKNCEVYGSVVGMGYKLGDRKRLEDEAIVYEDTNIESRREIEPRFLGLTIPANQVFTWSGLEIKHLLNELVERGTLTA